MRHSLFLILKYVCKRTEHTFNDNPTNMRRSEGKKMLTISIRVLDDGFFTCYIGTQNIIVQLPE